MNLFKLSTKDKEKTEKKRRIAIYVLVDILTLTSDSFTLPTGHKTIEIAPAKQSTERKRTKKHTIDKFDESKSKIVFLHLSS